jgi:hypothetical protein
MVSQFVPLCISVVVSTSKPLLLCMLDQRWMELYFSSPPPPAPHFLCCCCRRRGVENKSWIAWPCFMLSDIMQRFRDKLHAACVHNPWMAILILIVSVSLLIFFAFGKPFTLTKANIKTVIAYRTVASCHPYSTGKNQEQCIIIVVVAIAKWHLPAATGMQTEQVY